MESQGAGLLDGVMDTFERSRPTAQEALDELKRLRLILACTDASNPALESIDTIDFNASRQGDAASPNHRSRITKRPLFSVLTHKGQHTGARMVMHHRGFNPNLTDRMDLTPLMMALAKGADDNTLNTLLAYGARIARYDAVAGRRTLIEDQAGLTTLDWAALTGKTAFLGKLLQQDFEGVSNEKRDALMNLATEQAALIASLKPKSAAEKDRLLLHTLERQPGPGIPALLVAGANPNGCADEPDGLPALDGLSLLTVAMRRLGKLPGDGLPYIHMLLAAGADANHGGDNAPHPVHQAVTVRNPKVMRWLLNAGANIETKDDKGNTALSRAAFRGDLPMVKMLLDAGANKDSRNQEGKTPLRLAIASIFSNKAREIAMTLIRGGADVNLADNDGISPLHVAVVCNMREIIEALCNANAELNPRNEEGETPLEWAIQFDHHEAEALLRARGAVL